MYKNLNILVFLILLISVGVQAQVDSAKNQLPKDTVARLYSQTIEPIKVLEQVSKDSMKPKAFKPDPLKVVWMAAIIPGYGQILNKKYWKLPLVYGGFLGCAYAISWNSSIYNSYKNAYLDIYQYNRDAAFKSKVDKNPSGVSFYQVLPKGYTIENFGGPSAYETTLNNKQASFQRYRDLSIIITIAYYALTIVDAYVDAQMFDFDISPDLSMRLQPTMLHSDYGATNTLAMQCSFSLK